MVFLLKTSGLYCTRESIIIDNKNIDFRKIILIYNPATGFEACIFNLRKEIAQPKVNLSGFQTLKSNHPKIFSKRCPKQKKTPNPQTLLEYRSELTILRKTI